MKVLLRFYMFTSKFSFEITFLFSFFIKKITMNPILKCRAIFMKYKEKPM